MSNPYSWHQVTSGRVDIFARSPSGAFEPFKLATINPGDTYPDFASIDHVADVALSVHMRGDFTSQEVAISAETTSNWLDHLAYHVDAMSGSSSKQPGYWLAPATGLIAREATIAASANPFLFIRVSDQSDPNLEWFLDDEPFKPDPGRFLTIPYDSRMLLPAGARFDVVDAHAEGAAMLAHAVLDATMQLVEHAGEEAAEHSMEREALAEKRDKEESNAFQHEMMRFGAIFRSPKYLQANFEDPFLTAVARIGQHAGFTLPESAAELADLDIAGLGRRFGFKVRPVALTADLLREAPGPMLAYWMEENAPVAIYSNLFGSPCIYDPQSDSKLRLTSEMLERLNTEAFTVNATLPDSSISLRQFLTFGLAVCRKDLGLLSAAGIVSAMLGMAVPYSIGIIFSEIVPAALTANLLQLLLALLLAAGVVFVLDLTAGLASLRIQGRVSGQVTAAMWERLLRFPGSFWGKHGAGDVVQRLSVAERLHSSVQQMISGTLIKGQHYLVALAMMAFYYPGMAALVMLFSFLVFGASALTVYRQRKAVKQGAAMQGSVYNLSTELMGSISKIKAAGAERWAFNRWAFNFTEMRRRSMWSRSIRNVFDAFEGTVQSFALIIIFLVIAGSGAVAHTENAGSYLAFMTALATFMASTSSLSQMVVRMSPLIGQTMRVGPFLKTSPISEAGKHSAGELDGSLALDRVHFSYQQDGPVVLHDVSIEAAPGEFIAIVGGSGSGKSTLLKILLGTVMPDAGSVTFSGKDRQSLYTEDLQSQIAAVMQAGQVMPGSLLDNIRGGKNCSLEDAWVAAEMAGLAEDIKAMPMGMQTQITQGDAAFSGGQLQRLLIARAIAAKPRILVLDEATSALDEPTQCRVMQHLSSLDVTRVVVAHRLSTVQQADKIYVLDKGRVSECGSFEALIAGGGKFARLYASNSD